MSGCFKLYCKIYMMVGSEKNNCCAGRFDTLFKIWGKNHEK